MDDPNDKLEQVKKIKNGKGIQYLLEEAYRILGNPIVMFNTEYNLLAYNENIITDDPMWNEIVAYGTFGYNTQKLFMEEGFVDAVANAETIAFLISDKLKYDRISGKLYSKNHVHVANLVIMDSNRPFADDDGMAFEAICEVFSKEITKSAFYQTYGMVYQETYIRKLIDGDIDEKGLYAAHIAIIYDGLKPNLHLAVADVDQCNAEHTTLYYFRDLFKRAQPSFKYAIHSNKLIIIINSDNAALNVKKDLRKLNRIFEQNNIHAGISSRFENIFELPKRYNEAVNALHYGLKSKSGQRVFLYGDIPDLPLD